MTDKPHVSKTRRNWTKMAPIPNCPNVKSGPTLCATDYGPVLAVRDANDYIQLVRYDGGWQSWSGPLTDEGKTINQPAIASFGIYVFIAWQDASNRLWYSERDSKLAFSKKTEIPYDAAHKPDNNSALGIGGHSQASDGDAVFFARVTTPAHAVYYSVVKQGKFGAWTAVSDLDDVGGKGGGTSDSPGTCIAWGNSDSELILRGWIDNGIYSRRYSLTYPTITFNNRWEQWGQYRATSAIGTTSAAGESWIVDSDATYNVEAGRGHKFDEDLGQPKFTTDAAPGIALSLDDKLIVVARPTGSDQIYFAAGS